MEEGALGCMEEEVGDVARSPKPAKQRGRGAGGRRVKGWRRTIVRPKQRGLYKPKAPLTSAEATSSSSGQQPEPEQLDQTTESLDTDSLDSGSVRLREEWGVSSNEQLNSSLLELEIHNSGDESSITIDESSVDHSYATTPEPKDVDNNESSVDHSYATTPEPKDVVDNDCILQDSEPAGNRSASSNLPLQKQESSTTVSKQTSNLSNRSNQSDKTVVLPSNEAIMEALQLVQQVLPDVWVVHCDSKCFRYLQMSSNSSPKAIQKEIVINYNGSVAIFVHCVKLNDNHELFKHWPDPAIFDNMDYVDFCQKGATLCWGMNQFTTCVGANFNDGKELWRDMPNTYVDYNPYQESSYATTCRSVNCERLIRLRFNSYRCHECGSVLKNLKSRLKSASKEQVSASTTNKNLTPAQAQKKLSDLARDLSLTKKKNVYLKEKIKKLENLLNMEGVELDEDDSNHFRSILENKNLSEAQKIFLDQQVAYAEAEDPRTHKWHPAMIRWALKIKSHSTAAYEAMRDSGFINLPHSRTLFDYSHCIKTTVGVNKELLKMVAQNIEDIEKRGDVEAANQYHTLIFDEIYISQNLVYRKADGALMGYSFLDEVDQELRQFDAYVDGEKEPPPLPLASTMLAYMVKGLTTNVKCVIAAFPCKDLNKLMIHARTWDVIEQCEAHSVKILVIVCDGSPNNRAYFKLHTPAHEPTRSGIIYSTFNIFSANGRRLLFFFADVAHLLKTIRNALHKSREKEGSQFRCLQINGEKLLWTVIFRLYFTHKDDTLREGFKLNAQNVFLTSYSVMKVKYAAQVLSQTVANVLKQMNWPKTYQLINFIEMINKFFDCLNGAHSSQAIKRLNSNLAAYDDVNDPRFDWLLNDFWENFMVKWKEDNEKLGLSASKLAKTMLPYQAVEGIEISIRSFVESARWMLTEGHASFVMARAWSQDPLEQSFSIQRAACGGASAPNTEKFLRTQINMALQGKMRSRRRNANVAFDDESPEVSSKPLPKRQRRK